MRPHLYLLVVCLCLAVSLYGQEQQPAAQVGAAYLDMRINTMEQYLKRSEKIQDRLLRKLKKQEARLRRQLSAADSASYAAHMERQPAYDSMTLPGKAPLSLRGRAQKQIDSMKQIQQFVSERQRLLPQGGELPVADYSEQIQALQQELALQERVSALIRQRSEALLQLPAARRLKGLSGIQQDIYYAGEKIRHWKQWADEPDEAEAKALEYLQGIEGFEQYFSSGQGAWGGLGNKATEADLKRMGYQTKKQVSEGLQQQLGSGMEQVQQQMSGQISDYTESIQDVKRKTDELKQTLNEGKQSLEEGKATFNNLKQTERPAFKKNPERGKPFWQRLDYQYNSQTSRAGTDGSRPAMADWGASVAFRHTPKLSYGIGAAGSLGLGQDWQHIRFSYEGISLRAYADWEWQYGISVQAGYERSFRPANRAYLPGQPTDGEPTVNKEDNLFRTAFGGQQQAAYIGLMKRYRINSKWNGTFLAGYNLLWRQEGYRSPWMVRLGWEK